MWIYFILESKNEKEQDVMDIRIRSRLKQTNDSWRDDEIYI
ncbi:unnamed protein product [Bacillus thuringiensis DB27]|uniref:Uncharacterized protein n=1 Tax=Bacillus thuringiensis DB27 TaxID=1431339 RepID=W8YM55_BACTU|nr:unnamed protein product [Bacillus thuringiensis DB27]